MYEREERLFHVSHISFTVADLEESSPIPRDSRSFALCSSNRDISDLHDPSDLLPNVNAYNAKLMNFCFISKILLLFVLILPIVMPCCIFEKVDCFTRLLHRGHNLTIGVSE